jgi:hypothetical protein
MFFNSKLPRADRKELDMAFNNIQMNLENNYKELAVKARKEAEALVTAKHDSGMLVDKDYVKYSNLLKDYTEKTREIGR